MTIPEIVRYIRDLSKRVDGIDKKSITPDMIPFDTVRMKHISEGVRYIRDGGTDDIPEEGEEPLQGAASIFDYETNKLWIWNRLERAWKFAQLS